MRRWTSVISLETEAVGVPIGIRQKSATQFVGVFNLDGLVSEKWVSYLTSFSSGSLGSAMFDVIGGKSGETGKFWIFLVDTLI